MKKMLGIACFIICTFLACWLGIWFLFVGGIVQFIEGAKAFPVNALDIALGILKVICSGFVGWSVFMIGTLISSFIYDN